MRHTFSYTTFLGILFTCFLPQPLHALKKLPMPFTESLSTKPAWEDISSFASDIALATELPRKNYCAFQKLRFEFLKTTYSWLKNKSAWIQSTQNPWENLTQSTFPSKETVDKFIPYVQKLALTPGLSTVFIFGDIHGDHKALMNALNQLTAQGILDTQWKLKNNNHLVFLGNYTDRGPEGVEVWYTLFKLREANQDPSSVIILRGNHENFYLNNQFSGFQRNGYLEELRKKFSLQSYNFTSKNKDEQMLIEADYFNLTENLYKILPVALYLTCETSASVLCTHGGLEIGFDPRPLLTEKKSSIIFMALGELHRKKIIEKLAHNTTKLRADLKNLTTLLNLRKPSEPFTNFVPETSDDLHFLWNDFSESDQTTPNPQAGSYLSLGNTLTNALLDRYDLCCIFRGHQHDLACSNLPEGNHSGLYSHPGNRVYTLMSFSSLPPFTCQYESSFIRLVPGARCGAWKAWHVHDGEEAPLQMLQSTCMPEKFSAAKRSEPTKDQAENLTENLIAKHTVKKSS